MSAATDSNNHKRKFLIAADASQQKYYKELLSQSLGKALVFVADDGQNALHKIENDAPDVLFIDECLPKISGTDVVRQIFDSDAADMAIVILSELPDHQDFVEQVAVGQIQYFSCHATPADFSSALTRALKWVSGGDQLNFNLRRLKAGEVLLRQGEGADFVYILKRGHMQALAHTDGSDIILGEIEQQEFVGEMAYVTGEPRSADVVATTDCELIEIPIGHLSHLLFDKPTWSRALMRTLAKRLKTANKTMGPRSS